MGERQFSTLKEIIGQDPPHEERFETDKKPAVFARVSRFNGEIVYVEPGSARFVSEGNIEQ